MKPRMILDPEKDYSGYATIKRAASILCSHGFKKEAKQIHEEAKNSDYDDFIALKLLKKYMTV